MSVGTGTLGCLGPNFHSDGVRVGIDDRGMGKSSDGAIFITLLVVFREVGLRFLIVSTLLVSDDEK